MNLKDVYIQLKQFNNPELNNLLSEIKKQLEIDEATKNGSRVTRLKKCISIITKNQIAKRNPILSKYDIQDNKQAVTNSYICALLVHDDFISGLDIAEDVNYPNLKNVVNFNPNAYNTYVVSMSDLKVKTKLEESVIQVNNTYFDAKQLLDLCYLLNIDNVKEFEMIVNDNPYSVAYIKKENGSVGTIAAYIKQD